MADEWRVEEFGPPAQVMRRSAYRPPRPDGTEVLVDVRLAPVSYVDYLMVQGRYQRLPPLPFVPGLEVMGEVNGQRVIAFAKLPSGGFAPRALADRALTFPVPDDVDDVTAASCLMGYQTAYHAVHERGRVAPGETVVVSGASGVVGGAACRIASLHGARVIGVVGSARKVALALEAGARDVIDTSATTVQDELLRLAGRRGVDVVIDVLGGSFFAEAARSLGRNGRILAVGFTSGEVPAIPVTEVLLHSSAVIGVNWGMTLRADPARGRKTHEQLMALAAQGNLRADTVAVPFAGAAAAVAEMGQREPKPRRLVAVAPA